MNPISQLTPRAQRVLMMAKLILLFGCVLWLVDQFRPVPTQAPSAPLQCISYSPFYQGSNPTNPNTRISAAQIEQDLRQLHGQFNCVRTYSVGLGLDAVPAIAQKLGMQVYLGIWIGWLEQDNQQQIQRAIQLSQQYPNTIKALIVGNEVLLRGEQKPAAMQRYFHSIKQRTHTPISYADVWEFWRQHQALQQDVDFVTVHILPYWENDPVAIQHANQHIENVMQLLQQSFHKPILIGETGWPSQGRQRFDAQPGLRNQAQYLQNFLQLAQQKHWQYNLIEAYDQPWKRTLEGTVGGYWGIYDVDGKAKFVLGQPLAERQDWPLLLAITALLGLTSVLLIQRGRLVLGANIPNQISFLCWLLLSALHLYIQIDFVLINSIRFSDWMQLLSVSLLGNGLLLCGLYLHHSQAQSALYAYHSRWLLILLCLIALLSSLSLIWDGRYRNFLNPLLLIPVMSFSLHSLLIPALQLNIARRLALLLASLLGVSALILLWMEPSNLSTQIWLGLNILLAALLLRHRIVCVKVNSL